MEKLRCVDLLIQLNQVWKMENGNWNAALFMALTMPDICGAIAYPNLKYSGERYRRWFADNLEVVYTRNVGDEVVVFMAASDCWALRCSLLHAGSLDISAEKSREILSKFVFTTKNFHRIYTGDVLTLNVEQFCSEVCTAVDGWYKSCRTQEQVVSSISNIISIQDEMFSPIPGVYID